MKNWTEISILGFGGIGRAIALLLNSKQADYSINIIDPDESVFGAFLDLQHAMQLSSSSRLSINNNTLLEEADYIFHSAGIGVSGQMERDSVLAENVKITQEVFKGLSLKEDCKIIVITNPVDSITYHTWKSSGLAKQNVIGVGTYLDSIRMDFYLKEATGENFRSRLLGEHGKAIVFSTSYFLEQNKNLLSAKPIESEVITKALNSTIGAAKEIKKSGSTSILGIANCAIHLFDVLNNKDASMLPVSTVLTQENAELFRTDKCAMSLPCRLSNKGAFPYFEQPLNPEEIDLLRSSANKISTNLSPL